MQTESGVVDSLALARWHIDRYDRLRASTASRASLILSANALVLTGSSVLLGQFLASGSRVITLSIGFLLLLATSVGLAVVSIRASIRAIVTLRTSREIFSEDIPDRGAFHWGDTLKREPVVADFISNFTDVSDAERLQQALAELWTDIRQHALRYQNLRHAARVFQYAVIAFMGLLLVTVLTRVLWS